MLTVVRGSFEWNSEKAARNLRAHQVSFDEAATAVLDELAMIFEDALDSNRFIAIGASDQLRVLYVVHCERGERIRIISARRASRHERKRYEGC